MIKKCEEIGGFNVSVFTQPANGSRTIMLGDIHGDSS